MLTDWPEDCPLEMRMSCEALLAQAVREVDSDTRARLRVRLYADPELSARVLPREKRRSLMEMVRGGSDIGLALAETAGLDPSLVADILADETGHELRLQIGGETGERLGRDIHPMQLTARPPHAQATRHGLNLRPRLLQQTHKGV